MATPAASGVDALLALPLPAVCPDEVADMSEAHWEEVDGDDVGSGDMAGVVLSGVGEDEAAEL